MAFVNDQGRVDGISAEYLNFLRDALHLRFKLVPTHSWAETIRLANAGDVDIVVAASAFDGLSPGFGLSMPYVRYPLVIVTRETASFIGGLDDLDGAEVAIVGDVQTARVRFAGQPAFHSLTVDSAEDGLQAVAQGRAFAYIGNLGVIDRIVRERYVGTLRVAAPIDRIQDLSFGISARIAPLLPLVDRVLAAVPESEREQIQHSWLSAHFTFGVAPRTLWLVLAPVGTLTLLFLAVLWGNMQRLRKEARAREMLIATVSHEIRTPMSGIVNILQLLDHDGLSNDDRGLVGMAGHAAESLLLILNDILDFAKSENGELSLERAPMRIEPIVRHAVGLVRPEIERKGLVIQADVSGAVATQHIGDARRLGQVLLNLLGNAAKFTERGVVSVFVDVVSESLDRQLLSIRVVDTGIGISAEDQARLFSPFAQARGTIGSGYGGTGLGLAICKRLIERMGGTIALESRLGSGTTVAITVGLPIDRPAERERPLDPAPLQPLAQGPNAHEGRGRRILLVEDRQINREVLRRQLLSLRVFDCDMAENGARALAACERGDYAMIITDCAMPLLSGAELIARIRRREQRSAHRTVLVALTADATEAQRRACLQAGADEVCLKPLSLAQLRELLARFGLAEPAPTPASTALYDDLQPQLRRMLADDLASLRGLSSDTDKEKTREVAHAIAGAAAWFQLPEVAEAAQRLQRCLDEGRPARAALVALSDAIERALNASGVAPTQGVGGTEIGGK